jgi:hypothetical protein
MGTSNFYNRNASKVFALEDVEGWEYHDYMDRIECLKERVAGIAEKLKGVNYYPGGHDPHELRSFNSTILGRLCISREYKGLEVNIEITAILRSGYYEGANLDWNIDYQFNGQEGSEAAPELTEIAENLSYYGNCSENRAGSLSPAVLRWFELSGQKLINALEREYKKQAMPLRVAARFSNGETWYEKA